MCLPCQFFFPSVLLKVTRIYFDLRIFYAALSASCPLIDWGRHLQESFNVDFWCHLVFDATWSEVFRSFISAAGIFYIYLLNSLFTIKTLKYRNAVWSNENIKNVAFYECFNKCFIRKLCTSSMNSVIVLFHMY